MPINSQRYFMRKEDYEPRKTPLDSPFRYFVVKCLQCDCVKLTVTAQYDEETGEMFMALQCGRCGQQERVAIKT